MSVVVVAVVSSSSSSRSSSSRSRHSPTNLYQSYFCFSPTSCCGQPSLCLSSFMPLCSAFFRGQTSRSSHQAFIDFCYLTQNWHCSACDQLFRSPLFTIITFVRTFRLAGNFSSHSAIHSYSFTLESLSLDFGRRDGVRHAELSGLYTPSSRCTVYCCGVRA